MKFVRPIPVSGAMVTAHNVAENDHPAWVAGTGYAAGARVIRTQTHRIYESLIDGNSGQVPETSPDAWLDIGPTNRWAMFDIASTRRTSAAAVIQVDIVTGLDPDTVGLVDVDAQFVQLRVLNGSTVKYNETRGGDGTSLVFGDLPVAAADTIRITVTPFAGKSAAIGAIVCGDAVYLGETGDEATVSIVDYSRRETDDFGVTTLVRRDWSRRIALRSRVSSDAVDTIQRQLASVRATPVLWIGEGHGAELTAIGYYKEFSVDLMLGTASFCTLSIEGLPSADTAGAVIDPAIDTASDMHVVRPDAVTDVILTTSTVTENDHPAWVAGTNYATGARVIRTQTHRIYESLIDSNSGQVPETSPDAWFDIGPTNRWAMFDGAIGSFTRKTDSIIVTLTPAAPVTALAVIETDAASVRVQTGSYNTAKNGSGQLTSLAFTDLAVAAGTPITVTIKAATPSLLVSVGLLVMGTLQPLGRTEISPQVDVSDYSRKETDAFGSTTLVQRAWGKRLDAKTLVAPAALDNLLRRVAALRATPALWIAQDGFDVLTLYGFAREVSVQALASTARAQFKIEGLTTAAALAVPGALSRIEKLSLVRDIASSEALLNALDAQAAAYGTMEAERLAAINAWFDLTDFLEELVPAWDDTTQDTPVDRDVMNAVFAAYASAYAALLAAVQGYQPPVDAGDVFYTDGTPVQDLQPAAPGADRTGSNISAGIIDQGLGATANDLGDLDPAARLALVGASAIPGNLCPNGSFEQRALGWLFSTATVDQTTRVNLLQGGVGDPRQFLRFTEADTYFDAPGYADGGFPVQPGERLFLAVYARGQVANSAQCSVYARIQYFDGSGAAITSQNHYELFAAANVWGLQRSQWTVPAGAASAALRLRPYRAGGDVDIAFAFLGRQALGATVNNLTRGAAPPISPQDGDIWVDTSVTPNVQRVRVAGAWQVASTLNTGALADLNAVDLAGSTVSGTLPESRASTALRNSELVPSINTAATTAQWSGVTSRPAELIDGRIPAGLGADGRITNGLNSFTRLTDRIAVNVAYANAATVESLRPAAAGADPTGSNISAGFTGQGAWATSTIPTTRLNNLSDTGNLTSLANVTTRNLNQLNNRAWTNLFRANGSTAITDADAITAFGTAAAISGQGPGATADGRDVLNYRQENNTLFIPSPDGASFSSNSSAATGAIRIELPQLWTHTMLRFSIEIYEYGSSQSVTYTVGGYNYVNGSGVGYWINTFAHMVGSHTRAKDVWFGSRNGKACVWIGGEASVWSYPKVRVTNFTAGFAGFSLSSWNSGWNIALDTTAPGNDNGNTLVVPRIANPTAADAVFGQNTYETSGGAPATLGNFRTNLGTAAAFTGQGALATLNAVDLAGSTVGGTLPENRAATTLRNSELVPSINNAATTAQWNGVTGTGRPADNATVNEDGGGNLIPTPITLAGATFFNGAKTATVDGRTVTQLVSTVNSKADFSGFFPIRGGELLFFGYEIYCDISNSGEVLGGYTWKNAAGAETSVDLTGTNVLGTDVVGTANAERIGLWLAMPASAVSVKFYVKRPWAGGGNFYVVFPYVGRAQLGADVTASAVRTIIPQFPIIEIKQNEAGNLGNRNVTHFIRRGEQTITGGTWSLPSKLLGAGTATINASTGTVTLGSITQSGSYTVRYLHTDGVATDLRVNVTYVPQAAATRSITADPAVVEWFGGTTLSRTATHIAREGSTTLTGGTWSLVSNSAGSVNVNPSTGTATITGVSGSGSYTIQYAHTSGAAVQKTVDIVFYPANDPGGPPVNQ